MNRECIAASVTSLLRQEYSGPFSIVVVDDDSSDGTGAAATHAAEAVSHRQLTVVNSKGPPAGWTGKLWALKQGIAAAELLQPDYLLLTDADIVHAPDTLAWLVKQSSAGRFVLTSLMAKLRCVSLAERSHVPAFIYFFQMLFPFSWVCRPNSNVAGAAGGCMLIRADALETRRRYREYSQRIDRRLLVGGKVESDRSDLAWSDRSCAQHPAIRNAVRCQADDFAVRLRTISLFTAAIGSNDREYGDNVHSSTAARNFCHRFAAVFGNSCLARNGAVIHADITVLSPYRGSGASRFLGLHRFTFITRSIPLISIMRGRGGQWKGRVHADAPSLQ